MAGLLIDVGEMNMDITNVTAKDSVAPMAVQVNGTAATSKPTSPGNDLPLLGQISVPSGSTGDGAQASYPDSKTLHGLVDQANHALSTRDSHLKFSVAEGTDIRVVRIEDTQTGELIRQIPSEQMVAVAQALSELTQGMMFEAKA
jgi:flagellar protein FlaG